VSDVSAYVGGTVGRHFGLGLSPEESRAGEAEGDVSGHIGFAESAQTIAERLGCRLDGIERKMEPVHDDDGRFVSTKTIVRGIVGGDVRIELELEGFVDPEVETMDRIIIEGVPPLDMVIKPVIPSVPATANALVNAIPHVIHAQPGLMTPADLPLVSAFDDVRLLLK
jgi:4-hydroxy-tetrahydrodipicolinate reductase